MILNPCKTYAPGTALVQAATELLVHAELPGIDPGLTRICRRYLEARTVGRVRERTTEAEREAIWNAWLDWRAAIAG